jgi:hypothetical protein
MGGQQIAKGRALPSRLGKAKRAAGPSATSRCSRTASLTPPLPNFTREQIGSPAEGTEHEQDPESPPGVTCAQAWSARFQHYQARRASSSMPITSLPTGQSEMPASLKCAQANGIPMIVTASASAMMR